MVPGLSQRLDELRERKIDTELQVKRMAAELMELNSRLQELQMLHKDAVELCDKLNDDLHKLQEEREMEAFNLVMLLDLKQGQVEVDMEQLLDETFDAAMMEGSQISQLNSIIEGLGATKVEMMAETKSFRNKIHGVSSSPNTCRIWQCRLRNARRSCVCVGARKTVQMTVSTRCRRSCGGGWCWRRRGSNLRILPSSRPRYHEPSPAYS
jgi:hypothetical protein